MWKPQGFLGGRSGLQPQSEEPEETWLIHTLRFLASYPASLHLHPSLSFCVCPCASLSLLSRLSPLHTWAPVSSCPHTLTHATLPASAQAQRRQARSQTKETPRGSWTPTTVWIYRVKKALETGDERHWHCCQMSNIMTNWSFSQFQWGTELPGEKKRLLKTEWALN